MAYSRRDIRGGAVETTLSGAITGSPASFAITSFTGWPDGSTGNFIVAIDRPVDGQSNANFEKILCSTRSSGTVNIVTRGYDGTSAHNHSNGARVEHSFGAIDFDEANYWVAELAGAADTAGDLVVADGADSLTKLAKGSNSRILAVDSGGTLGYTQATSAMIGTDVIVAGNVAADAIGTSELGPLAVTDAEVATANKDGAAGTASMRTLGTGAAQAAAGNDARLSDTRTPTDNSVTNAKMADNAIGNAEMADAAINTAELVDNAVTRAKLATGIIDSATVAASEGSSSTSYTNLATSGPAVTLTTGTTALITLSANCVSAIGDYGYMGFAVSGATTRAAADADSVEQKGVTDGISFARTFKITGLTAGSNTFTVKYRTASGAGFTWGKRDITVVALPT